MERSDIVYEYNNTQPGFACVCVNQLTCFCMSNKTRTKGWRCYFDKCGSRNTLMLLEKAGDTLAVKEVFTVLFFVEKKQYSDINYFFKIKSTTLTDCLMHVPMKCTIVVTFLVLTICQKPLDDRVLVLYMSALSIVNKIKILPLWT